METINPFTLKGKTIVVTGASSGIGKQCAISCSKMGARVCILGRNVERLQECYDLLDGDQHLQLQVDLKDEEAFALAIEKLKQTFEKIDGLIYAAGVSPTGAFRSAKKEQILETFEINVLSAMMLTKHLCKAPLSSKEGMSFVYLSSVMSQVGTMGKTIYGMSKGALVAGVKSLAVEYASKKYRFNCISPGVVATPMSMSSHYSKDAEALAKVESQHLLGIGTTEDIANASIYLLSDASRWVTGTNLIVDGGYLAK